MKPFELNQCFFCHLESLVQFRFLLSFIRVVIVVAVVFFFFIVTVFTVVIRCDIFVVRILAALVLLEGAVVRAGKAA